MKFELPNGMTVILGENHAAPVVAFQAWVNVGSADEGPNLYGIAHVHEHMLFKGTKKRGVGDIAKEIEAAGGDINAWTSFDQTVYHLVLASRFFDTGLDILADALGNSQFDSAELARELEVVLEEIRRGRDMPGRRISDELFTVAYEKHPYGRPVIGYDEVVAKFSRQQILDFYKKWYVPNNMTFVVVGDFDTKKAAAKIRKAFAGFKKGNLPRRHGLVEPPQQGMKIKILRQNIQESYVECSFHIPNIHHDDTAALDVLSLILGHGDASRMNQRIKEEKGLVNDISTYAFTPKDPGVLVLGFNLHHDKLLQAITQSVRELASTRYEFAGAEELRRAKINLLSEAIYEKETVEGQAKKLAYFQTLFGDPGFEKTYYDRIEAVSLEDLRRVAERYLRPENLTLVLLFPDEALPGLKAADLKRAVKEGFDAAKKEEKAHEAKKKKEVQIYSLQNGIKVLLKENHEVPLVSAIAVSQGGLRFETPQTNGINNYLARVWTKGARGKTAAEIAHEIESMAGSISAISGRNSLGLSVQMLSEYVDEGLTLFTDVLRHPDFDAKEVEIERRNILEAIRNLEDNLSSFAFKNFLASLYGDHPCGMHALGPRENVSRFTPQDLRAFYQEMVKPDNLLISVVGDVQPERILKLLEEQVGDWKESPFQKRSVPAVKPIATQKMQNIFRNKEQAHIVFGFQGATLFSEDRYALDVLNAVLSGMGGRLFLQLRDRESLAYTVSSFAQEGLDPGFLGVYIGTDPRKVDQALAGIQRELRRVTQEKISKEELKRATENIVGNFEIDLQRNSAQASSFAYNELYGLGWDEYERYAKEIMRVNADDVLRVARKYLQLDKPVITVIRPEEKGKEAERPLTKKNLNATSPSLN